MPNSELSSNAVAQFSVEGLNLIERNVLDRPASMRFEVRWIRRAKMTAAIDGSGPRLVELFAVLPQ